MRRVIILILCSLFILGCTGCPNYQVRIDNRCCVDSNENQICDLDEDRISGSAVQDLDSGNEAVNQTINETTTITLPEYNDCNHTVLSVIEAKYYDGNNSKVKTLLYNAGEINIIGFKIWLYGENGLDVSKTFSEILNVSAIEEFNFDLGNRNRITNDTNVSMIRIAPVIEGKTCEKQTLDFTSVDR